MATKKAYYIRIQNSLVEVTHEVYLTFYRGERQERTQREKERRNRVVSYDAWDTDGRIGQDLISLPDGTNVEDTAIAAVISEKLHQCLALLPEAEQHIIEGIYFDEKSEPQMARELGIPLMTLRYRRDMVLQKLKKMISPGKVLS